MAVSVVRRGLGSSFYEKGFETEKLLPLFSFCHKLTSLQHIHHLLPLPRIPPSQKNEIIKKKKQKRNERNLHNAESR